MLHRPLLLADRHETASQMIVVLSHQPVRDLEVVDVAEDEGAAAGVFGFAFEEGDGLIAPVAEGVEVVGRMVTVVEGEAVGLLRWREGGGG